MWSRFARWWLGLEGDRSVELPEGVYRRESEAKALVGSGYEEESLNAYIVKKSQQWLAKVDPSRDPLPPHLVVALYVVAVAVLRIGRPVKVVDFGGGAPTVPVIFRKLGVDGWLSGYEIVETEAFRRVVPPAWREIASYAGELRTEGCDLLMLSAVLPYLGRRAVRRVYEAIGSGRPRFVYLGRTSFLREDFPLPEVYTVQRSRFRDHGPQVDVGMRDVEERMASYVRRHFKLSEIESVLEPLGYRRHLALQDDTGLGHVEGLGLYADNALWELRA